MNPRGVFLDKDGTLIENVPYNVDPDKIVLAPRAIEALGLLHADGFRLLVISNQAGAAFGYFSPEAIDGVEARVRELLGRHAVPLAGFYCCPHHPQGTVPSLGIECQCRKPAPGLILRAAEEQRLDLHASWFVGDILDDVEAGNRAGCRTILVDRGGETEWRFTPLRRPTYAVHDLYAAAKRIVAAAARTNSLVCARA